MNRTSLWLAPAAAAWLSLSAAAAPPSEGPISDAMAVRATLPQTRPPSAVSAVLVEPGIIELQAVVEESRDREVVETISLPDGRKEQVTRIVRDIVYETRPERVTAGPVKFFTVTAEGKLQAIDAAKATGMLKQKTPVLTGDGADVDPRALELVKPGTLYLVLPPQPNPNGPPPDIKQ